MESEKVGHQFLNVLVLPACSASCIYCRTPVVQTKRWHAAIPRRRNLSSYVVLGEGGWLCHMTPPTLDLHFPSHLSSSLPDPSDVFSDHGGIVHRLFFPHFDQ